MAKTLTVFLAADVSKLNRGVNDADRSLSGLGGKLKNMLGPALIAAGAAAAAFATKLAVDGVKAAIADEAAVAKLTQTLENLGLAHNIQPIEDYIKSLERSLGVSDLELRPAYDRLVRSTQDVGEANQALALALDISAGTGKSLDAVVQALGRAYDGNTQGLSRLGAGLNTATLATKDMDLITGELSRTFGGQATRQAQTFQGQLQRLQTAQGNLAEAFGAGLLKTLGDTNDTTQGFIDTLESLEPVMESLGGALANLAKRGGDTAVSLGKIADGLSAVAGTTPDVNNEMSTFGKIIDYLINDFPLFWNGLRTLGSVIDKVTGGTQRASTAAGIYTSKLQDQAMAARGAAGAQNVLSRAMGAGTVRLDDDAKAAAINAEAARDAARAREYWTSRITYATVETERNTSAGSRSTSQTNEMTEAQKKSVKAYEKQADVVRGSVTALNTQLGVLAEARKAFDDYAQSIETSILSNFSFSKALQPAMNEAGEVSGQSFVDNLNAQITSLQNYANVITSLRASGAEQSLVDQIASMGPEAGGALGQALIDQGLVPTVQGQVDTVERLAKETGLSMAEQFKGAGVEAAINLVNNAVAQVRKDRKKLTDLGDGIGKLIGSGIKKEIAQAVAEAVRAAEAAKAAARAEAVAAAEARAQIVTDQQVGQAFARIIAASNARTGRDTNPLLA
jgi:hypothetical protein